LSRAELWRSDPVAAQRELEQACDALESVGCPIAVGVTVEEIRAICARLDEIGGRGE
jgi:hypothetical protein